MSTLFDDLDSLGPIGRLARPRRARAVAEPRSGAGALALPGLRGQNGADERPSGSRAGHPVDEEPPPDDAEPGDLDVSRLQAPADQGADDVPLPDEAPPDPDRLPPPAPTLAVDPATLLDGLNPQQREAVLHTGGPLLVVAGAGSGKTRVLTRRVAHLVGVRGVQPSEILAITFTNKAAAEMRERVAALVGRRARAMWVSTFHSSCVRILRREAKHLGLAQAFSIYDAADSQRLMTMVARDLELDPKRHPPRALTHQVSNLKNELVDSETFADRATGPAEQALASAYTLYQRRLRAGNALDFDDLIMTTVHLLQAFPQVAEHYRRRFRHVLVDEYQDTNHAQYVLVREIVGRSSLFGGTPTDPAGPPPAELCVVGDADQAIYAFRGATIRNIVQFEQDYPDAIVILLEQNYRSTQTILSAANAVIAKNPGRKPKNLWSEAGAGVPIVGYVADNEHDEAAWVATEVDRLADDEGVRPSDVAVFYRTNAQSRVFEEVFIRVGLPYKVVGGVRFYERREVRDLLAYLRLIANPTDEVSLRRILNVPRRGIGDRAQACVDALANRNRIPFAAALERAAADPAAAPGLAARSAKQVSAFVDLVAGLRADSEAGAAPADIAESVLARTGYLAELSASDDPQDQGRVENLQEMVAVAREFSEQQLDGTLAQFMEQVALVADADEVPEPGEGGGVVTLMTLHTAKGLEFPVVFLTGLEDGVFPHLRTLGDPKELAEERRLAYVGITRAQQRLYLSRAVVRSAFGSPSYNPASRFLEDVPEPLVRWERSASALTATRESASASVARRFTSGSGRPTTGLRPVPNLSPGDRVNHDVFGLGRVVATSGAGDRAEAMIDFGDGGPKRLLLRYAPVEKL